ncbi:MAG: transporter substrate-binding domain-containing protein [Pseudomonadota bacterium]
MLFQIRMVFAEKPLYIGIQSRNLPYTSYTGNTAEGILVDMMRGLCNKIEVSCDFSASEIDELLESLRYRDLDAVILSDHFLSDKQAQGLFFLPGFCTLRAAFIWKKGIEPAVKKNDFSYKSIGVSANSYLELYLQNHFPLNIRILPYKLMENAIFDLLNDKVDAVFSDVALFEARAKKLFTEDVTYRLPTVATVMADYIQPERVMTLIIRDSDDELKQKLLDNFQTQRMAHCADFLSDNFKSKSLKLTRD